MLNGEEIRSSPSNKYLRNYEICNVSICENFFSDICCTCRQKLQQISKKTANMVLLRIMMNIFFQKFTENCVKFDIIKNYEHVK